MISTEGSSYRDSTVLLNNRPRGWVAEWCHIFTTGLIVMGCIFDGVTRIWWPHSFLGILGYEKFGTYRDLKMGTLLFNFPTCERQNVRALLMKKVTKMDQRKLRMSKSDKGYWEVSGKCWAKINPSTPSSSGFLRWYYVFGCKLMN